MLSPEQLRGKADSEKEEKLKRQLLTHICGAVEGSVSTRKKIAYYAWAYAQYFKAAEA